MVLVRGGADKSVATIPTDTDSSLEVADFSEGNRTNGEWQTDRQAGRQTSDRKTNDRAEERREKGGECGVRLTEAIGVELPTSRPACAVSKAACFGVLGFPAYRKTMSSSLTLRQASSETRREKNLSSSRCCCFFFLFSISQARIRHMFMTSKQIRDERLQKYRVGFMGMRLSRSFDKDD